jgi:hypothetical protein
LEDFHQSQFTLGEKTRDVECVTTAVVMARNVMNALLAFQTSRAALDDLGVEKFVSENDRLGIRGLPCRFRTDFPKVNVPFTGIAFSPRGFMLPRWQVLPALRQLAKPMRKHYGKAFRVRQGSGRKLEDIATQVRAGNLVLISGMNPPGSPEQEFLGGSPHTLGPVIEVDFDAQKITLLDTGPQAFKVDTFEHFQEFWGRKSRWNLYVKPYTMTVLIPD